MKKQRGSKQQGQSKKPSGPTGGGGFSFKDRSGKEHFTKGGNRPQADRPSSGPTPNPNSRSAGPKAGRPGSKSGRPQPGKGKFGGSSGGFGGGPGKDSDRPSRGPNRGGAKERSRGGGRGPSRGGSDSRSRPGRSARPQQNRDQFKRGESEPALKAKASIDKNQKGFAFLIFDSKDYEDVYVSPRDASTFLHGDRVEVLFSRAGEIIDVKLVEHRFREMVGRYLPKLDAKKKSGWLVYERKRAREQVFIPEPPATIKAGDWFRAELKFQTNDYGDATVTGKVLEVYGPELPASSDIQAIAAEFSLFEEHPAKAVEEAKSFTLQVPGRDLQGRTDLRNLPFITIDGETARDFDDAIYVEREGRNYILWVAIADVSHYVREGTAIDKDARSRGTSVYFPERAFHMLPRALSEDLCSLKPNVPRLTLVSKMKYNSNGERESTQLYEAVIQSKRRATYNEIEIEHGQNGKDPNWEFQAHYELYGILRKMRERRGSIDFELPEMEVIVDSKGDPTDIRKRSRLDAHRLIEEFMVAANESVTEWALEKKWPFLYRVHDEPSGESLERFREVAQTVGFTVNLDLDGVPPSVLADIARKMQGHPAQLLLNNQLLRSMRQAAYSSLHGIHYGLASAAYTHFTSPIRRYPDLVVHRMLRWALRAETDASLRFKNNEREQLEEKLAEIAEHCSYRERLASDAERESIRLKQVRLLKKHVGEEFDATIIGMMDRGMFAQLDHPFVEGMIPKESMMDDFYEFNEERMIFYGKRKRRTFRVGDRVRIRVDRADIEKRQADFALIDSPPST